MGAGRIVLAEAAGRLAPLCRAFTSAEALALGVPAWTLERLTGLVADEETCLPAVTRVAHGIYLPGDMAPDARTFAAEAALRFPKAILALRSAARLHGLTVENQSEACLAMPRDYRPKPLHLGNDMDGIQPIRWIRWSEQALTDGIGTMEVHGIPVRITSPVRTVVDYFRYQACPGEEKNSRALFDRGEVLDVLDRYLAGREADEELVAMAGRFGVRGDVEPLLEGRRALTRRM